MQSVGRSVGQTSILYGVENEGSPSQTESNRPHPTAFPAHKGARVDGFSSTVVPGTVLLHVLSTPREDLTGRPFENLGGPSKSGDSLRESMETGFVPWRIFKDLSLSMTANGLI
jgi:hypothetical protein